MSANQFFVQSLDNDIKSTFYNSLVSYVLNGPKVTLKNLPFLLGDAIKSTIRSIISESALCDGIQLPMGTIITRSNCPVKYREFFNILLDLKSELYLGDEKLTPIIREIQKLDSFREINPTQFILEATGLAAYEPVIPYEQEEVTPELIRETFYNEMICQALFAIEQKWLTRDDLECQESKIYFAFPALVLVESIQQSQQCNGIALLNRKVLNKESCPIDGNFLALVEPILALKDRIKVFTEEQLLDIKQILASDSELTALSTPELVESFAAIKVVAIEISQRSFFHRMVETVIGVCLESLSTVPALSS